MTDTSATCAPTQDVNTFRLQKIYDMQKEISVERNERERTYTKHNKIDRASSIVETTAECGGIAAGTVGIASLASVAASPVGFVLEGVAIGLGGMAMAMKYARYKITKKLKKHDKISVLAESKLNTIESHVSKAIEDGCIRQEEFVLINEEQAKYSEMKENIRTRFTPKDAPPDVKAIVDKDKKRTCRKTFEFKVNLGREKSYYDDVLAEKK